MIYAKRFFCLLGATQISLKTIKMAKKFVIYWLFLKTICSYFQLRKDLLIYQKIYKHNGIDGCANLLLGKSNSFRGLKGISKDVLPHFVMKNARYRFLFP